MVKCYNCGEGHVRSKCPKNLGAFKEPQDKYKVGFCMDERVSQIMQFPARSTAPGLLLLSDTGCNCVIVSEKVVPDVDVSQRPKVVVEDYLGWVDIFPTIRCYIRCPYFEGWIDSLMNSKAPSSSLRTSVGDLAMLQSSLPTASSFPPASEEEPPLMRVYAVETCNCRMKRVHPLVRQNCNPWT
ncbi:uncharacterized protein LOC123507561 [Portunus trituberculatus]|uniref:uncharacterized protein LOC123507561 n=1 Tax=Portunus trituberculatus TaxID=210409 RepID=UPI001E1D075B|nr:uncharacterized protein LOC123507561 [Portunus trituberculatus]